MKQPLSFFLALIIAIPLLSQTKDDKQFIEQTLNQREEIVFRFPHNNDANLIRQLGRIVSIDKINDSCIEAYGNRSEFEQFKTYNLPYQPVYEYYRQTRAVNMATTVAQMANWDRYPTYPLYLQMMQNYANTYPDICRLVTHGQSVRGRDIVTLVISDNVNADEDEPEFWWSSTMHGDETAGYYFLVRLIDFLLTNYQTNEQVARLINNIEIHISPNTNPDGTFYNSADGTSMTMARRNNQNNIDLNRNFPFINGTAANGNQPEITLMTAYAEAHNFVMAANGHGGDECLNYPWDEDGWTHAAHPNADDNWWEYVCWQYVDSLHTRNANLMTGPSDVRNSNGVIKGSEWYSIDGGRQDYMNYYRHCKEVTMEWSTTKKLESENLNTYWNAHYQSMLDFTEQVLFGFNGIVSDACSGEPLGGVNVFINNHDTDNTDVFTSAGVGDYHRPIYAGTYSVTFSKEGYQSKTITVTTQNQQSTRLDVQLNPQSTLSPDFTANVQQILEGQQVEFTNVTEGNFTAVLWSFDGGNPATSNEQNPIITYATAGTYNVTLQITDENGCTPDITKEAFITVSQPQSAEADFVATITDRCTGSLELTNLSQYATEYYWDFGDGNTSADFEPTHQYSTSGLYTIRLVATNPFSSDTTINEVEILIPEITSTEPASTCEGANLSLTAHGTGNILWYDAQEEGNLLAEGETYANEFLQTTTVYAESQIVNYMTDSLGLSDNSSANTYNYNQTQGMTFTVNQALTLLSFDVYCSQNNQTKTISVKNSSNQEVFSQQFTLSSGKNTLSLNLELQPATYTITINARYTYRQQANFPYQIADLISITDQYNYSYGTRYYYSFFNWKVRTSDVCTSERVPVTATILAIQPLDLGEDESQCGGEFVLDAGEGYDSYLWSNNAETQVVTISETGTYSVTVSRGSCFATAEKHVTILPIPQVEIFTQDNILTAVSDMECSYLWTNAETEASIQVSNEQQYCVTVTSADFCQNTACVDFSLPIYNIDVPELENGEIHADEQARFGEDFTFTVIPDNCYIISEVFVDNEPVSLNENNQYTIYNVTASHTITATFVSEQFVILASASQGGRITPQDEVIVNCGENQHFVATADEGYELVSLVVDGEDLGRIAEYTFENVVDSGHTISAFFEQVVVVEPCEAVAEISANFEEYGVVLTWQAAENAAMYHIYRNGEQIANLAATTYIDLAGQPTDNYFIITECESGGFSEASESVTVATTAIAETEFVMQVFPNPFACELNIVAEKQIQRIVLLTVLGQEVFVKEVNSDELRLNLGNLQSGVYYVRVDLGDKTVIRKVLKAEK